MKTEFPRKPDGEPFAWGLSKSEPVEIWERFSPAYEAQAQRLFGVLRALDFSPKIGGAGSEDGEYIRAEHNKNNCSVFFYHLEDPADARFINSLDNVGLREWIIASWIGT